MKIFGNTDVLETLDVSYKTNTPTLLVGQTGTGKNTILRYVARSNNREQDIVRINLTGETTVEDLTGRVQLKGGNTIDQDGWATRPVREGKILILDEVNACQPEVLFALQSLLDDDKSLTLPSGEVVKAHPDFRVFATMNPNSGYVGTKSLNKAFMSRFGVVLEVNYVDPKTELDLLNTAVPELERNDGLIMVETARMARERLAKDMLSFPISTRDLIYWATMAVQLKDLTKAFTHTVASKAEGDKEDLIRLFQDAVRESDLTTEHRVQLIGRLEDVLKKLNASEHYRSIIRADADDLVNVIEKVEAIATKRASIEVEVAKEITQRLAEQRQQVKDIANTLKEKAEQLDKKEKDAYKKGYDTAKAEILKKLGVAGA